MKKGVLSFLVACFAILFLAFPAQPVGAASVSPTPNNNLSIGLRNTSELVATSNGYMRVFYDGNKIQIEYYDNSFNIQSKKSIAMELSVWGGFYAGSDAYYVVEGQNNTAESDTAEVIRVIKYDTNWNKKGTAKITGNTALFGGEVRYPFDYGCVEMIEYGGKLYIVTGHEGYVDPSVGQGHQGFLMIAVDTATMKGEIVDSDLWHSFAQYIDRKGSDMFVLELSEGSRFTALSKFNAEKEKRRSESISVLNYGGSRTSAWAIPCYASVDGMAVSSNNVLCLGTSIDQAKYDTITSNDAHNIYLTVTPISNFTESATTVKWITNYSGGGKCFLGTKITKVNDNRFMISWEEFETSQTPSESDTLSGSILHYIFVDENGNKLTKEFTAAAPISDCQPIVKGSNIVYYASNGIMVDFYTINANNGSFSKKAYRVAGDNVTWELKDGVLTISGSGAISGNLESKYRYPVSSTRSWFSYSSTSEWNAISDKVEKIVIDKGITSIPDKAFTYFDNLEEVSIGSGVKSIGKEAFARNMALRKITIPASVTSIGEDILWTGYYWTSDYSHVVYATICGNKGSYAETYAKKEGIRFVAMDGLPTPKLSSVENVDGGIKITWGKVSDAEKYRIYYKTGSGSWKTLTETTSTSYTWKNAKIGTEYSFTVCCITSDSQYVTSNYDTTGMSIIYLEAPELPSLFIDNEGINISWDAVTGVSKYRIMYKTEGGSWKKLADTAKTSYAWSGAQNNTRYYFSVQCLSSDGKTTLTGYNTTGESIRYLAKPSLPTLSVDNNGISIKWNKVTNAMNYRILYKSENSDTWEKLTDTTETSYIWNGAKANTRYYFTVQCISANGKIGTSGYNTKGATLRNLAKPELPKLSVNNGGIYIKWDKVSNAVNYRVLYKTEGGSWSKLIDTTETGYTWKGAKANTRYYFTVQCISADATIGTSGYDTTGKTIRYLARPSLPWLAVDNSGITIKWDKVPNAVNYRIQYKTEGGSWKKLVDTKETSYTWKEAKVGTRYYFSVQCISSDGSIGTSGYNTVGTTLRYLAKPGVPTLSVNNGGINIKWNKMANAVNYRILYKTEGGNWTKLTDTTSTSYTWKGAKANTRYYFTVQCVSANGSFGTSGYDTTGTTLRYLAKPSLPTLSVSNGGINIKWSKVPNAVNYRIMYKTEGGSWKKLTDTKETSYTWKGAKAGTTYYFTVQCISSNGSIGTSGYNTNGKSIRR